MGRACEPPPPLATESMTLEIAACSLITASVTISTSATWESNRKTSETAAKAPKSIAGSANARHHGRRMQLFRVATGLTTGRTPKDEMQATTRQDASTDTAPTSPRKRTAR